jgi:hypothetical protein
MDRGEEHAAGKPQPGDEPTDGQATSRLFELCLHVGRRDTDDQLGAEDHGHDLGDDLLGLLDGVGPRPRLDVAEHPAERGGEGDEGQRRKERHLGSEPRDAVSHARTHGVGEDRPRVVTAHPQATTGCPRIDTTVDRVVGRHADVPMPAIH